MIRFQDKTFKSRELSLPEFGEVLISTTELNNLLIDKTGSYSSTEAQLIDDQIFYFVEENEIELQDKDLESLIISQVK